VLGEPVSELDGIESGVGRVLVINDGNVQRSMLSERTPGAPDRQLDGGIPRARGAEFRCADIDRRL
jgi:hypothetical protein